METLNLDDLPRQRGDYVSLSGTSSSVLGNNTDLGHLRAA